MLWSFSLAVINYAAVSHPPTTSYVNGFMFCKLDSAHIEKMALREFLALKKLQLEGQLRLSAQPGPGLFPLLV